MPTETLIYVIIYAVISTIIFAYIFLKIFNWIIKEVWEPQLPGDLFITIFILGLYSIFMYELILQIYNHLFPLYPII